jgi:pyruvate,water dikinase
MNATEFRAPDASSWELDPVHYPRPVTRFHAELYPRPFARGFAVGLERHGLLLRTREFAFINGFAYLTSRMVEPDEIPARLTVASKIWEERPWREDVRVWDEEVKPAVISANRALQQIDPTTFDRAQMIQHLARCRDHIEEMVFQHMRFTVASSLPVGDFIAHATRWTDLPAGELLGLLRGASPVSAGVSAEMDRLVAALRQHRDAQASLAADSPTQSLEKLRRHPGEVGEAAAAWLDLVGYRLIDGQEIGDRYALELPGPLVGALRAAIERTHAHPTPPVDGAAVRDRVPAGDRAAFDGLLAEARYTYRLRDERGVFTDMWAQGLTRRALLAAGTKLAGKGRIDEPEHLVEADWTEMRAIISGDGGPPAAELAERARYRTTTDARSAPRLLGPEPPHPPIDQLPPPAARAVIAIGAFLGALFTEGQGASETSRVRGIGASRGIYEGTARRVAGPSELGRLRPGDVLVTASTTEAFNVVLPLLGAIVTDRGGALSHAAIVARELGIPGVVGTRDATNRIPDGARVRVDGRGGEVTLL